MAEMTLTRAMVKAKTLKSKLEKFPSIYDDENFVGVKKGNEIEVKPIDKSVLKSFKDTFQMYQKIKTGIAKANAMNTVTVGGIEMTIAEAILRKQNIKIERNFIDMLKRSLYEAKNYVTDANTRLENDVQQMLSDYVKSGNVDDEKLKEIRESLESSNKREIYDPNKIESFVQKKEEEIENFLNEIDVALSEANATITIDV